jgi:hypothetical protein
MPARDLLLVTATVLSVSASATAQDQDAQAHTTDDGVRPRLGFSMSGGFVVAAARSPSTIIPGEIVAMDARAGVQVNDVFAVYVQPSAVIGVVNTACFNMTEMVLAFWAPVLVDFTIANRVSIAAGGGIAAVPQEAPGWTVHFRAAVYAFKNERPRRHLAFVLDTRAFSFTVSSQEYAGGIFTLGVGYEWF